VSPPSRKRGRRYKSSDEEGENIGQDKDEDWIAPEDALILVRNPTVNTRATLEVEQLVWQRISGYVEFQSGLTLIPLTHVSHKVSNCL
jgi:hypothetical protein